jgi:hypothetical protein
MELLKVFQLKKQCCLGIDFAELMAAEWTQFSGLRCDQLVK